MNSNSNNLNWFEIAVLDMERAKTFYEKAFDITLQTMEMPGMLTAFFPYEEGSGKAAGGLSKSEMNKPSMDGTLVYLNGDPDMTPILERIPAAGGKVLMPKTLIAEGMGYMAFFSDTEGNRVGLHSNS